MPCRQTIRPSDPFFHLLSLFFFLEDIHRQKVFLSSNSKVIYQNCHLVYNVTHATPPVFTTDVYSVLPNTLKLHCFINKHCSYMVIHVTITT